MAKVDLAKRTAFATAFAELGNATQAALQAGVPQSSAHSMGYKWLRDDRVVALVREAMDDRLKALGPLAIRVVKDIMLSEHASPQTRLQAARDVLDRLGWVPPKRAEMAADAPSEIEEMSLQELQEIVSGHRGIRLDQASLQQIATQEAVTLDDW